MMDAVQYKSSRFRGLVGFWTGIGGLCLVAAFGSALTGQGFAEQGFNSQGQPIGSTNQTGVSQAATPAAGTNQAGSAPSTTTATPPPQIAQMLAADGVLGFASPDGAGGQMVTLVHASRQWMTVYAISSDGEIRLRSSRPLEQDFSVQFNLTDPTPEAIKQLNPQP